MKFSTKEDIDAPIDSVFDMTTDFESFERSAMRRGASVRRVDALRTPGVGMEWDAEFAMRGRRRRLEIKLTDYDPEQGVSATAVSPGLLGHFDVELIALSRTRTRMAVELEIKPQNLSARLFVQSLRLAKANLTKRFKMRVAEYAKMMENQAQKRV